MTTLADDVRKLLAQFDGHGRLGRQFTIDGLADAIRAVRAGLEVHKDAEASVARLVHAARELAGRFSIGTGYASVWNELREALEAFPEPKPPVDPVVLRARKLLADAIGEVGDHGLAEDYLSGVGDDYPLMKAVLTALREPCPTVELRNGDTAHFSTYSNGTWGGFTGVTRADEIGETNV